MLQYPPNPTMMNMESSMWKPHVEIAPNCPRCASPNTKFCYYNNYSLSQPRYFCKGCKRYWTKGGSLRNVPVGGGCRKNRRSRHSATSSSLSLGRADRVGLSYLRDLPSPTPSGSDQSVISMSSGGSEGPAEIDLADVFAKFLNQSSEQRQFGDQHSPSGTSCGSLELQPSSFDVDIDHHLENFMMECQIPPDFIEEARLYNVLPQDFSIEEDIQYFVSQHPNLYELQDLLDDDELPQDIAGKDYTRLSNCSWQQGFTSVSYNDQAKIDSNLVTDDWSSLDLSSYGIFARQ